MLLLEMGYKAGGFKTLVITGLTREVTQTRDPKEPRSGLYRVKKFKRSGETLQVKSEMDEKDAVVEYVDPCNTCP